MSKHKITNSHGIGFAFGDTVVKPGVNEYDGLSPETLKNIQNAGHLVEAVTGEHAAPVVPVGPVNAPSSNAPPKPLQGTSPVTPEKPGPVTR